MIVDHPRKRFQPSRADVRGFSCPACGARPSEPCQGTRGPRKSNHLERVDLAQSAASPAAPTERRRTRQAPQDVTVELAMELIVEYSGPSTHVRDLQQRARDLEWKPSVAQADL